MNSSMAHANKNLLRNDQIKKVSEWISISLWWQTQTCRHYGHLNGAGDGVCRCPGRRRALTTSRMACNWRWIAGGGRTRAPDDANNMVMSCKTRSALTALATEWILSFVIVPHLFCSIYRYAYMYSVTEYRFDPGPFYIFVVYSQQYFVRQTKR